MRQMRKCKINSRKNAYHYTSKFRRGEMSDIFIYAVSKRNSAKSEGARVDSDTFKTFRVHANCTASFCIGGGKTGTRGMAGRQKSSHGCGYFVERIRGKNVPDREVGRAGDGK